MKYSKRFTKNTNNYNKTIYDAEVLGGLRANE